MGEQPTDLSDLPVPPRRGRPRPSRARVLTRRLVALVVLLGGIAAAVVLVTAAFRSGDDGRKAAPTTTGPAVPPTSRSLKIVFPEGFTRREMAERITVVDAIARRKRKVKPVLSAKTYLAATAAWRTPSWFEKPRKRRPLEGFLFPATYEFLPATTSEQLVQQQLAAFRRSWSRVNLRYARTKNLTPYDVLIIASMVEKEVLSPEERPLVAAVIYNRLKAGMPLQIDATVRYGLNVPPTQSLRQSQLDSDSPYNTRKRAGLTPTPIANPGLASLQAAAHPANVDYVYFVRKPDKVHHFFTASADEFNRYLAEHGYGPSG